VSYFQPVNTGSIQGRGWTHRLPHAAIFAAVALLYAVGGLEWLEYGLMDSRFAVSDRAASGNTVHVGIDSRSIRELETWPWSRSRHADLIRRLSKAGAARIVIDIDLSSRTTAAADADLAAAIAEAEGRVILPVFKQRASGTANTLIYTEPMAEFLEHAQTASVNVQPETDSLIRRYNRVEPWQGAFVPSVATQLSGTIPNLLDPFYIDYSIRPESISYFSFVDVLEGRFPRLAIKGKTVFVGATAVELGDMLAVPVHVALPGSMIQVLAYESVVLDRTIERSTPAWSFAAALLLALLVGPAFSAWAWPQGMGLGLAGGGLIYGGAAWLQASMAVSADISPPLLVIFLSYLWGLAQQLDVQSLRIFKQHMAAVHRRAMMDAVAGESYDGIMITDADGRIDFVNPAACKLIGLSADEIGGQNILRFLRPDTSEEGKPGSAGETETRVLVRSKVSEIETNAGKRIPVEYSTTLASLAPGRSPLERRTDTRSAYIYTFRDMRESLKAQSALLNAADKAIAADKAKSELLANVSHELRTPLNAIIGFSNVIKTELFGPVGNDKYAQYIEDINMSGELLLELVNNLLTVSKMDSGNLELSEQFLRVDAVVDECLKMLGGAIGSKSLTLEADVPDDLPQLFADPNSIRQMLLNLMGNAAKFTPEGGTIRILAELEPAGELAVIVADNGIGIAQDELENVVKPFHQVEDAMQRSHGGAGLGLHIVNGLVELHGAEFDIQSELGVGTKITVRFPRDRVEGFENVVPLSDKKPRGND